MTRAQVLGAGLLYAHPEIKVAPEPVVPVNKRQQWFLNQLSAGNKVKSADVTAHWKVTERLNCSGRRWGDVGVEDK
jgi:hypothetical protein